MEKNSGSKTQRSSQADRNTGSYQGSPSAISQKAAQPNRLQALASSLKIISLRDLETLAETTPTIAGRIAPGRRRPRRNGPH